MLTFHNILNEQEKQEICNWKYEDEYAIYNLPPLHQLKEKHQGICNPDTEGNYYAFYDDDIFIGYVNLVERNNKFSLGISIKPQLCGQGYGQQIINIACETANRLCPGKPVGLQVRSWNKRAINCYKKSGFHIVGKEYELTTPIVQMLLSQDG